jgi:adenosylhomocysteine nucleosidase
MDGLIIVLVSANSEWKAVRAINPGVIMEFSPYGEWFTKTISPYPMPVVFFHGGWGKIAAAASTQYVIDRWHPEMLINLGTCGGFDGCIERGEIILVDWTVVYDIFEQMGDFDADIAHYSTELDLSWLKEKTPLPIRRSILVSGDRDLMVKDIPWLKEKYSAVAGDWESGAIAWVAKQNSVHCLILRGVTDLVGEGGGEAYNGNIQVFHENAAVIMRQLIESLPGWLMIL